MQKNIWPVLILTAVLGTAVFIGFRSASKPQEAKTPAVTPDSTSPDRATTLTSQDSTFASSAIPSASSSSTPAPKAPSPPPKPVQAPVTTLSTLQRINEEIAAAADSSTPESLSLLVSYASDDNADIRTSALNGLIRRGDAEASPLLRAAAKKSDSSDTVIALLKTADYLELPAATLGQISSRPKVPKEKPTVNPRDTAVTPKPVVPDSQDKP